MKEKFNIDNNIYQLSEKNKIMGHIYKITNTKTNKIYIGQTGSHRKNHDKYRPFGFTCRFNDHMSEAFCNTKRKQCTYLNNALRKYGKEVFTCDLLEICKYCEMSERETFYIKKLNSLYPMGYNLTTGGKVFKSTDYENKNKNINQVSKRGRDFGYKHKESTRAKIKERINDPTNIERAKNQMKKTMEHYYDEAKSLSMKNSKI